MKINLVLPHQLPFPPLRGGGVEQLNWLLARQFVSLGHEVTAFSRVVPELPARETDEYGIKHVRVVGYERHPNRWLDHFNGLRYARNVYPALLPADITSFHTPFSFLLRRKPGAGICAHTIHRTPKWPLPLYRNLNRVYCGSDAVLAQARRIDARNHSLKRIYNCIALPPVQPAPRVIDNGGDLLFLYLGRFVQDKGIEPLVKGFEIARRKFPRIRFATVGPQTDQEGANGKFFKAMSRYVADCGLNDAVTFKGPVYDKALLNDLISTADVICVPSLTGETFSMAILEAMALAKPVLVSDFSPMPEAVDHLVTGYVTCAGSSDSIAEGICYFAQNPVLLAAMGSAGFQKATSCFSVERIAAEYLEDFEMLTSGEYSPPSPEVSAKTICPPEGVASQ